MPLQCIGDVILVPTARDCDLHADRFGDLALEARVVAEFLVADEDLHAGLRRFGAGDAIGAA
jgi:hypothetical protein